MDESDIRHIFFDVLLKFGGVGPVCREYSFALQDDDDFGLAGGMEFGQGQRLNFFLGQKDDVHSFLELVNNIDLQVLIEWRQGLTGPTPGGIDVDDKQLGVSLRVVSEEMVGITDDRGQLCLFLWGHMLQ